MAVSVISQSATNTENDNSGTTSVVNFPTHLAGDLLIAVINASNGSTNQNPCATHTVPAGWTEIADISTSAATANGIFVAWHIATSDDELTSETFTAGFTTGYISVGVVIRGADQTTPIDVSAAGTAQGNAGSNTTPTVETTVDDVLVVRIVSKDDDADTPTTPSPGGYAQRFRMSDAGPGNATTSFWFDMIEASAGLTGTEVISWSGDNEENISFVFGVRPAPEGGNFDQDRFRARNDDGTDETDATWKVALNTDWVQKMDENFRIRFGIEELDDVEDLNVGFQLQYNLNGAGWNDVNAASSVVRSSASTKLTDGEDTTEQLAMPGTFLTENNGVDEVNGLAAGVTAIDFTTTVNQEVEVEYCCQLRSADVVSGDSIQLRVIKGPNIVLGTYTNTPTMVAETFTLTGEVRDTALDVVGTVRCILLKHDGAAEASRVYSVIDHVNANGSGVYVFTGISGGEARYMVVGYNDDTADLRGATDDVLQPTSEAD